MGWFKVPSLKKVVNDLPGGKYIADRLPGANKIISQLDKPISKWTDSGEEGAKEDPRLAAAREAEAQAEREATAADRARLALLRGSTATRAIFPDTKATATATPAVPVGDAPQQLTDVMSWANKLNGNIT